MYAAGSRHPHKAPSLQSLEAVTGGDVDAVIGAEALRDLLHRYRARSLMDEYEELMARDALHAAVAQIHSLESICSYDRDFDRIRGLRRIQPA